MMGILEYLNSLTVANEAGEDITGQVNDMVNGVTGRGGSVSGRTRNPTGFNGTRDMARTDNIFGTEGRRNAPATNPTDTGGDDAGTPAPDAPDDDPDTDTADTGDDTPDDAGDDTDTDNTGMDDTADEEPDSPIGDRKIYSKNRLRDNMIYFHNILQNQINSLTNSTTIINDERTIEVINMVISNFRDADDLLYDMIVNRLEKEPYEELQRRYITIRQVYDIAVTMLEKHFNSTKLTIGNKKGAKKSKVKR